MKRFLLASTFLLGIAAPAQAQWICLNCATEISSNIHWVKQAADMVTQIQGGVQRLQMLQQQYAAITRITDLGSAVGALSMVGVRNPLPVNPSIIQSLLSGQGGAGGTLSNISGLLSGLRGQNSVYAPQDGSWIGQEVAANGESLSAAQALALEMYRAAQERMQHLPELQRRIDLAEDPSEREALIARFAAEQNYISTSAVQVQTLANYMQAQVQLMQQRREERMRQSIDEEILTSVAGAGLAAGANTTPTQLASVW